MSKRLKSFHKLFFIVIFSILFSGVIGSSNSPELPEKIAPELEQIESLPRRTKPAELNIEVTKIKSEPLEEVYIDRENKNIYVDFSKKREQVLRGVRNAEDLEKKYNLVISENIQSSGEIVGKGRTKMATNPQVMNYEMAELDGKKMLKISYENEPEKLYIQVQEQNTNIVAKIYSLNISKSEVVPLADSADTVFNISNTLTSITIPAQLKTDTKESFGGKLTITEKGDKSGLGKDQIVPGIAIGIREARGVITEGWAKPTPILTLNPITIRRRLPIYTRYRVHDEKGNELGNGREINIEIEFTDYSVRSVVKNSSEIVEILKYLHQSPGPKTVTFLGYPKVVNDGTKKALETLESKISFNISKLEMSKALELKGTNTKIILKPAPNYEEGRADNQLAIFPLRAHRDQGKPGHLHFPDGDPVYHTFPNIIIEDKPLVEELKLGIIDGFNLYDSIKFTKNGVNNTEGIALTSNTKYYLSSPEEVDRFKLNNGEDIFMDSDGNTSTPKQIEVISGGKTLKIAIQYINRYPVIKILNENLNEISGIDFTINFKHFEGNLQKTDYILIINIKNDIKTKDFEIIKNISELILNDKGVEESRTWLEMQQLNQSENMFPVISIDTHEKWVLKTTSPLNPTANRGYATLQLGLDTLKIPVNIRETPYQNVDKFFVYDRGDMTNRNLAIGGYTTEAAGGRNNKVRVDFQIELSEDNLKTIKEFAKKESETPASNQYGKKIITIPYATSGNHHFLHTVKGIREGTQENKIFNINENNIIDEIPFPQIKFLLEDNLENIIPKSIDLTFKDPVPKSNINLTNLKGTFDISKVGDKIANNMPLSIDNPPSLNINSVSISEEWKGFTLIPEVHEIDLYLNGSYKQTINSTLSGHLSKGIVIESSDNKYSLIKGQLSPIAIGIEKWDLGNKEDIIELRHKNIQGRIVARDIYKIKLQAIDINNYLENELILDSENDKTIKITGLETELKIIELGSVGLKNYDKDLTVFSPHEDGIKITLPETNVTLKSETGKEISGKIRFEDKSSEIKNPNQSKKVIFEVVSGEIEESEDEDNPKFYIGDIRDKIKIELGENKNSIVDTLKLEWRPKSDELEGGFYKYSVTLGKLIIKTSDIDSFAGPKRFIFPGKLRMDELSNYWKGTTTKEWINLTPIMSVTNRSGKMQEKFEVNKEDLNSFKEDWGVRYKPNLSSTGLFDKDGLIEAYGFFQDETGESTQISTSSLPSDLPKIMNRGSTFGKPDADSLKLLITQTGKNPAKVVKPNEIDKTKDPSKEWLESSVGVRLTLKALEGMKTILENNPTKDIVIFTAQGSKDRGRLSMYINQFKADTNGKLIDNNSLSDPKPIKAEVAYVNYPDIVLIRSYKKTLASFKVGNTYLDKSIIKIKDNNLIEPLPEGVTKTSFDSEALMGLSSMHEIEITLPSGEIKKFETSFTGFLETGGISLKSGDSTAELHIRYKGKNETEFWLENIVGNQKYENIKIKHINLEYNQVIREHTLNLEIEGKTVTATENNKLELSISARYNPIDGQLNSSPIIISETGTKFPTEVLDLKLIAGKYPTFPDEEDIYISYMDGGIRKEIKIDGVQDLNLPKTKIRFSKKENELIIKPLKWTHNATDEFILLYKNLNTNKIEKSYDIDIICPEFFVAYSGCLDFGRISKYTDKDTKAQAEITLEYNTKDILPSYSLDIFSDDNPKVDNFNMSNRLYLDDEKNILIDELKLIDNEENETNIRKLLLEGILKKENLRNVNSGNYQKTIQILIHIK